MATVKTIVEKAYTKVNGEYEVIAESSDDFKTYLNVLNQKMDEWFRTPYVKWQSLFNANYTLPDAVVSPTLIYAVANATDIKFGNTPFDTISFVNGSGVVVRQYRMTDQAMFNASTSKDICMLAADGLHLKYLYDDIIGTSIRMPAYVPPTIYTTGTQEVVVDSVAWLVTSMAAFICDSSPVPFIARNADKFHKEADMLMKEMRENNRHRQHLLPKNPGGNTIDQGAISFSEALTAGVGFGDGIPG